jgi:hypothetical protein
MKLACVRPSQVSVHFFLPPFVFFDVVDAAAVFDVDEVEVLAAALVAAAFAAAGDGAEAKNSICFGATRFSIDTI